MKDGNHISMTNALLVPSTLVFSSRRLISNRIELHPSFCLRRIVSRSSAPVSNGA